MSRARISAFVLILAWARVARGIFGRVPVAFPNLFNLYELDPRGNGSPRQLTSTTGGATWPDVSPDGKTIVYVGYTADGFDLFGIPYPTSSPSSRAEPVTKLRLKPPSDDGTGGGGKSSLLGGRSAAAAKTASKAEPTRLASFAATWALEDV